MKEAKKFPKKLEIIASCRMCGSPVYGPKTISTEDSPLIKRSCACVYIAPVNWCYHNCGCHNHYWHWQIPYVPYVTYGPTSTTALPNFGFSTNLIADSTTASATNVENANVTQIY